uniref:Uncharacterized protein n=1 Tax=Rhizophora mucronata TaxID=61149 RepID=A0A2P2PR38_RHIMU
MLFIFHISGSDLTPKAVTQTYHEVTHINKLLLKGTSFNTN